MAKQIYENATRPSDDQDFGPEFRRIYKFTSRDAAWAFMRVCDEAGFQAGFPNPVPHATSRNFVVSVIRPISSR
jgi:hypothetical protein